MSTAANSRVPAQRQTANALLASGIKTSGHLVAQYPGSGYLAWIIDPPAAA